MRKLILEYSRSISRSDEERSIVDDRVCTIDRNLISDKQTMRITTSYSCRLIINTTKCNTFNFNQFFDIIQPSCQFRTTTSATQLRNRKFITRQIVRTSVCQSRLLSINDTNNVHDNFLRGVFVDIHNEVRTYLCSRIPVFYNTIQRTSTLNELVQRLFFILNSFSTSSSAHFKCTISFWPTDCRVYRDNTCRSIERFCQFCLIRNNKSSYNSFFGKSKFVNRIFRCLNRNKVFNQSTCLLDIRICNILFLKKQTIFNICRIATY